MSLLNKINFENNKLLGSLTIASLVLIELISIMGWRWPLFGSIATIFLVLMWLIIASRYLPLAIVWLMTELITGSFGYYVSFNIGSIELSLRFCLFLAAFSVMLYRIASDRHHVIFRHPWSWWYVGAIFALVWASARGYYNWNSLANLFLDLNGYLYILLLPLILEAYEDASKEKIIKYVKVLLMPAIVWLSLRTMILLYLFTHIDSQSLVWLYKWYRDSGLGEITPAGGGFWRVFSQSHLYSGLASVLGFVWLWRRIITIVKIKLSEPLFIFIFLALLGLVASLSRSLWLGVGVAWFLIPLISLRKENIRYISRYIFFSIILVASTAGGVLAVSRLNWPLPTLGAYSTQAFANRFGVEPAGQSRLNLWPPLLQSAEKQPYLGSGFGSTVAYYSTDPRAVQSTAGGSGLTVTYAFEWGWLDFWYKFGLIGLVFFTAWLVMPIWRGLVLWRQGDWFGGVVFALIALCITHFTTPYLNHPLGLGAVMVLGAAVLSKKDLD